MEEITLTAQPRTVIGKQVRQLRRDGQIPAVIYGRRTAPTPVQIEEKALRLALQRAGSNQLVKVQVSGNEGSHMVLLRGVQREPISRRLVHLDLYEVIMTERIRTTIPMLFTGESPIVKQGGALMYHGAEAVEVECLPGDLIPHIEVNLDGLAEINQEITVADLDLGEKLQILTDPSTVLARVIPARAEEAEEATPAAQAEVEVVKREKPEE